MLRIWPLLPIIPFVPFIPFIPFGLCRAMLSLLLLLFFPIFLFLLCFLFLLFPLFFVGNRIPLSLLFLSAMGVVRDGGASYSSQYFHSFVLPLFPSFPFIILFFLFLVGTNMPTPLGGPRLTESLDSFTDRSRMFRRLRPSKIRTF